VNTNNIDSITEPIIISDNIDKIKRNPPRQCTKLAFPNTFTFSQHAKNQGVGEEEIVTTKDINRRRRPHTTNHPAAKKTKVEVEVGRPRWLMYVSRPVVYDENGEEMEEVMTLDGIWHHKENTGKESLGYREMDGKLIEEPDQTDKVFVKDINRVTISITIEFQIVTLFDRMINTCQWSI